MGLCWKCRDYILNKYGANAYYPPYAHCHHDEPEEKPKENCGCEYLRIKLYKPKGLKEYTEYKPIFCPSCGRKL